jgi:hypothetical protein
VTAQRCHGGRFRTGAAALACAAITIVAVTAPAASATAPPAPPRAAAARKPTISLFNQPAWSALNTALPMDVIIPASAVGDSLRVTAHRTVTSRSAFTHTLDGQQLGNVLGRTTAPVASLVSIGTVREISIQLGSNTAAANSLPVSRAGVYPLEVALIDPTTGATLSSFVTYLVAVDPTATSTTKLDVAWIWELGTKPSRRSDGTFDPSVLNELQPSGRLGTLASELDTAGAVPLSVAVTPETLEGWTAAAGDSVTKDLDITATLRNVRIGLNGQQVISGPYVNLNLPSLITGGLGAAANAEIVTGAGVLSTQLGQRADPRTALVNPADGDTFSRLRDSNVDRVVTPESSFTRVTTNLTPAHPFTVDVGDGSITTAAPDTGLSFILAIAGGAASTTSAALTAQQILAGLSVTQFESPNVQRGIVLDAGSNWAPSPTLIKQLVHGLESNPLLTPVTLDTYFNAVAVRSDDAGPARRTFAASKPGAPVVSAADYASAQADVNTLVALAPPTDPNIALGRRALLTVLSADWGTGSAARATALGEFDPVTAAIGGYLGKIQVPSKKTVTLTAEEGKIPLSFVNHGSRRVAIKVTLAAQKLAFPDGASQTIELDPGTTTTQTFVVQTRTTGTFPLTITVTTADGRYLIQRTQITIRSTALNGVGLVLTIGAGAFLALWWLTHSRKARAVRRSAARSPAAVAPVDPAPPSAP